MKAKIKILFLAANSGAEARGRVEEEAREIWNRLRAASNGKSVDFVTEWAVRIGDLQKVLLQHKPHVLHFSGRGSSTGGIMLAGDSGRPRPVNSKALAQLLRILKDEISVVVLNACYSRRQAVEFAEQFDYTIWMNSAVEDKSAITFSASFYQALGFGRTVSEAFELAKIQVRLEGKQGHAAPALMCRPGVDTLLPLVTPTEEAESASVVSAVGLDLVRRYAGRAREGLEPHILPRILRDVVHEKYLPAISRGVNEGIQRVIPIVGSAGYGKSTILGSIYDDLKDAETGWVALVRCNDLVLDGSNLSVEKFAVSLGEGVNGVARPVTEIASGLAAERGRGVLLIDTLDIVLNERLVPALRGALLQLLDGGTTVAFTCRGHEYRAFLEPARERLAGLVESIDRYEVPPFTTEEARKAAHGFTRSSPRISATGGGDSFAESLLKLSADNRSLLEIVRNPLLLAMLCDLFGEDGIVPHDLTVSRLYEQYWKEKITRSRKHGEGSPEAILKTRLCMSLSKAIFEASGERLREWASESDLRLRADQAYSAAFAELFSEGVFTKMSSGRVRFFHQTFLEYAVARWLATGAAEPQMKRLLGALRDSDAAYAQLHWWPIIRQLLTIADAGEFDQLLAMLDVRNLATFRAAVYAAASRDDPQALRSLLPHAFELGDAYQDVLRDAINATSAPMAEVAWEVAVSQLQRGTRRTAVKAATAAGALAARRGAVVGHRFAVALDVIRQRADAEGSSGGTGDEASNLLGWLLSALGSGGDRIDEVILRSLREYYPSFGETHRAAVVRLHLAEGVPAAEQSSLLKVSYVEPAPQRLKKEMTLLLEKLLPELVESGETIFGGSLVTALHAPLPAGWDKVQARAVGRHLRDRPEVLSRILSDLLEGDERRISRNQTAVDEALHHGAEKAVITALLDVPVSSVPPTRVGVVGSIIRAAAAALEPAQRELLMSWLAPLLRDNADKLIHALTAVSNDLPSTCGLIVQLVMKLPEGQRADCIRRVLRDTPEEAAVVIADGIEAELLSARPSPEAKRALAELYGVRSKESAESITKLVRLSLDDSVKAARAASNVIVRVVDKARDITASTILPLSKSRVVGVRHNWLGALSRMLDCGLAVEEQDIADACAALESEKAEPVLQSLCNLIVRWVRAEGRTGGIAGLAFGRFANHVLERGLKGDRTVRSLIVAHKVIAQREEAELRSHVASWVRTLLQSVDLQSVDDGESEMIDLLSAVARVDLTFLPALVDACPPLPIRNVRAVVSAIKRVEGPTSKLLDQILVSRWGTPEVKSLILHLRGL